ncbi:MAG: hypothetical protein Q8O99_05195 [bacterium]|nr:hypothetical protein [bacterium]
MGTPVSADNEGKVVTARFQDTAIKITIRGEDYTFDTPGHIPQRILEYAHKH